MPIFEYLCQECSAKFEKIVFNRDEMLSCPKCGGEQLQQLLSTFAVSGQRDASAAVEPGPCPCGAPQRGMCGSQ